MAAEKKVVVEGSGDAVVKNGLYTLNTGCFSTEIKEGDTFVKFFAPWCGHCQKLGPVWESLAGTFRDDQVVKIAKLDCTENKSVCQKYEVAGYPTLVYFRDGEVLEVYKGGRGSKELVEFVEKKSEQVPSKKPRKKEEL